MWIPSWLVVSIPLKNISQREGLSQIILSCSKPPIRYSTFAIEISWVFPLKISKMVDLTIVWNHPALRISSFLAQHVGATPGVLSSTHRPIGSWSARRCHRLSVRNTADGAFGDRIRTNIFRCLYGYVWKCWVYSQWNSHLVGIMISKTIGYNGVHYFQTNPYTVNNGSYEWLLYGYFFG